MCVRGGFRGALGTAVHWKKAQLQGFGEMDTLYGDFLANLNQHAYKSDGAIDSPVMSQTSPLTRSLKRKPLTFVRRLRG